MTQKTNQIDQPSGQGLAIASMVLGILTIVTSLVWFVSIVLGILAIVFGVLSVSKPGRKMAIAGLITAGVGIVLSILVVVAVFIAQPALQRAQRDAQRMSDVSALSTDVFVYQSNNRGALPSAADISTVELSQITSMSDGGTPSTSTATFTAGTNCDGQVSARGYAIRAMLESGAEYCLGS